MPDFYWENPRAQTDMFFINQRVFLLNKRVEWTTYLDLRDLLYSNSKYQSKNTHDVIFSDLPFSNFWTTSRTSRPTWPSSGSASAASTFRSQLNIFPAIVPKSLILILQQKIFFVVVKRLSF